MKSYSWNELRDHATTVFGGPPNPDLETLILPVFQSKPESVVAILKAAADDVRAGRVQQGWGLVRTQIAALASPDTVATGEAQQTAKRERARLGALAWVRNVGAGYDTETEVESELFGEHGRYKQWPELHDEILEAWRALG